MPRARPKGALERSAVADLVKNTLSRIPTLYGQLSYLASLRDPNTGIYRHHGLFLTFGREESVAALQSIHKNLFVAWLEMTLAEKARDLTEYVESMEEPQLQVIKHWKQTRVYRTYIPSFASPADTSLFIDELEVLLDSWR